MCNRQPAGRRPDVSQFLIRVATPCVFRLSRKTEIFLKSRKKEKIGRGEQLFSSELFYFIVPDMLSGKQVK